MKKYQRHLPLLLIAIGVVLVCWPLGQKAYAWMAQRQLRQQWSDSATVVAHSVSSSKASTISSGISWTPTRIVIPDLKIDAVIVNGFDEAALRRGPAHDPESALPGHVGNCVIAAHRNVYGSWFARVDQLFAGSLVQLITPTVTYNYHTVSITRISEADRSVLAAPSDQTSRLTLITCTLPHSTDRVVVTAVLGDAL